MKMRLSSDYDYIIIGGGFYGACLALFLRSISERVLLVEAESRLMTRASRVNQARIHTGFHYPRSALTAVKSLLLHRKFIDDFPEAVVDDFQMLYAIARNRSKVSAKRFYRMFRDMGAPIALASSEQAELFNPKLVDAVFACDEAAFDHAILVKLLSERLFAAGVELKFSTRLVNLFNAQASVVVNLSDGTELTAKYAFNVTYSQLNSVLENANLPQALLKHELSEIALITPPSGLKGIGVTIMDGLFFSCMPYPGEDLHSLSHVRYTPHESWTDDGDARSCEISPSKRAPQSRVAHMIRDAQKYVPSLIHARHQKSFFEVKTVLIQNENDDGRPILYQRAPADSRIISILGGKLDNVYDLFELIRMTSPEFQFAHGEWVVKSSTPWK